jgi:hypothetical protein
MEIIMDNQRAQQIFELANRLINLDAGTLSEQQLQQRNDMISKLKEEITMLDEASLAQMRDYFKATDPKVRSVSPTAKYVANTNPDAKANMQKRFRSQAEYDEWLEKNGLKQISGVKEQDVAEGEQRMSRAAKGYEKYGKEGMQALAKAGREGKDLDKIRDKYNKYDTDVTEEFNGEYDDEAGMAKSNLHTMSRAVNGLLDTIEDNDNLPEWAQEKLATAETMVTSVWDYLLSQKEQGIDPKVQGVSETKKPSPKLTAVNIKKTDTVSEEINTEAYERLQKVFAFKNYES